MFEPVISKEPERVNSIYCISVGIPAVKLLVINWLLILKASGNVPLPNPNKLILSLDSEYFKLTDCSIYWFIVEELPFAKKDASTVSPLLKLPEIDWETWNSYFGCLTIDIQFS